MKIIRIFLKKKIKLKIKLMMKFSQNKILKMNKKYKVILLRKIFGNLLEFLMPKKKFIITLKLHILLKSKIEIKKMMFKMVLILHMEKGLKIFFQFVQILFLYCYFL